MEWKPIETASRGEYLLFFPAEKRNGRTMLAAMIRVDAYPVSYPRQPSHWMPVPPAPDVPSLDYDAK